MKKIVLSISFILLILQVSFAQNFKTNNFLCDSCEREISLRIESSSFIKNNEYFNKLSKGFTGLGFFLKPSFEYYFAKNTKATAGVYLLKYSGVDQFTQVIPLFSIQHKLTKNLELILGSLYGALNHQLEEPLYRFDRYYQDNIEYGMQFLYHTSKIESDLWLNWEKFIFTNSPYQEELVFGNTSNFIAYQSQKLRVELPIQFLISHKGGQIDSSPNPVASIANGMSGIKINYQINAERNLSIETLFFLYNGWNLPESGVNSQPYKDGTAAYFKVHYNNNNFHSILGYWSSNKFISPRGESLFLSVSDWDENFAQEKRKLITAKIEWGHPITKFIKVIFKADAYYDIINQDFSHALGLYFVINESFLISKIKGGH